MNSRLFVLAIFWILLLSCGNTPIDDKKVISEIVQDSIVEPVRVTKSNQFYEGLLNDFLKKHFHKRWHGENYMPNSLRVNHFSSYDTHTDEVIGTFSFEGKLGKDYDDREYRALVLDDGDHYYHVTFFRKTEYFLGLKKGGEAAIRNKPFVYKAN